MKGMYKHMITSKERAFLRGLANNIEATVQIGKGGINENMQKLVCDILENKELVKVHVLDNSFSDVRDVCNELSELVGAEQVQVIGSKFVLYKESKENKKIDLKKLTVKTETKKPKKEVKPLYKAKQKVAKERKRVAEEKEKRAKYFKKSYSRKG